MKNFHDTKLLFSLLSISLVASFMARQIEQVPAKVATLNTTQSQTASLIDVLGDAPEQQPAPVRTLPDLTIGLAGTISFDHGVSTSVATHLKNNFDALFTHAQFLATPDITFATLSGSTTIGLGPLQTSGIDVLSLADAHAFDTDRPTFQKTLTSVRAQGLLACGAGMTRDEAVRPSVIAQNGIRVGFVCFLDGGTDTMTATQNQAGILRASDPDFDTIIAHAKQNVDTLVVSFEWSDTYAGSHTDHEQTLAERALADGANMIVGTHPGGILDVGTDGGKPILYSLGALITSQKQSGAELGDFATISLKQGMPANLFVQKISLDSNFAPQI